jgi:hypothetical protein
MLRMTNDDEKLALDTERLMVHLTGLQAEVEAKVRRVNRFREQMQAMDTSRGRRNNLRQREQSARLLISGIDEMLQTNLIVRDMLHELREAAEAVLSDLMRN